MQLLSRLLVWLIRLYQRISRRFPSVCRFRPSCSEYTLQAILVHGPARGLLLGAWRILRCNPLCQGGEDPVPPRESRAGRQTSSSPTETDKP